jgi:hypothetical protein
MAAIRPSGGALAYAARRQLCAAWAGRWARSRRRLHGGLRRAWSAKALVRLPCATAEGGGARSIRAAPATWSTPPGAARVLNSMARQRPRQPGARAAAWSPKWPPLKWFDFSGDDRTEFATTIESNRRHKGMPRRHGPGYAAFRTPPRPRHRSRPPRRRSSLMPAAAAPRPR